MTSIAIISNKKDKEYKRGEVYLVRFDKIKKKEKNTEIKEPHPAVIISNEWINKGSKRVIVVPLTSTLKPFYES
jgi:mRNA-degrading endonuclease toxin of MazEF toxin-antitoxin module